MMNMFQQQPAPEVHALIGVIDLIVSNQRPSSRVAERYSAMSRDGLRLVVRGALPYAEAVYARFAFARVSLEGWHLGEGRGALAQAVIATAEALLVLADGRTARPGDKAAVVDAAALLTDTVAKPASFLRRLRAKREQVQGVARTPWLALWGGRDGPAGNRPGTTHRPRPLTGGATLRHRERRGTGFRVDRRTAATRRA
jgi:hypothetical protein